MPDNPYLEQDRRLVGDIYTSDEPMENLTVLCDELGSRFAGTPGERRAAELIAERLRSYGCPSVDVEEYEYAGWTRGPARLAIVEPIERELECISLPYSPAVSAEGELVDVEMGTPEDYAKADLGGRIVLVSSRTPPRFGRWIHRKEKYDRAVMGGAAAFLFAGEHEGAGPETGSLRDDAVAPIAGLSIAHEDAAYLKRLSRRHDAVRLALRTSDVNEPRTSWNVVGELLGRDRPDEVVALGCHYDGHDISQGAVDPASGLVVVLEVARVLARYRPKGLRRTVRFLAWGTEELGLIGSLRYASRHRDELDAIRFYLNLDSAGGPGRKGVVLHDWPALEPWFRRALDEMASDAPVGQHVNESSDHFNLLLEGVPTGALGDPSAAPQGRGFGHTRWDTLDKVSRADLREAAALAARLVLRMGEDLELAPQPRSAEAVQALLDNHPNLENYRLARALEGRF